MGYIWGFGARFSHLAMIISFFGAYFTKGYAHAAFGSIFALALILRIIWGLIGTKYSRFSDFSFKACTQYIFATFKGKREHFIGHNPASSVAIIFILALGLICVILGFLALGAGESSGVFAFLKDGYESIAFVPKAHEILANILLGIICVHILGALIDFIFFKGGALKSMITGYKNATKSVEFSRFQRFFSIFWAGALVIFGVFLLNKNNFLLKEKLEQIDYKAQNSVFVKECASCHMLYAPFLLSGDKWQKMMEDLENHFGDDASIDEADNANITEFLLANSADKLRTKWAVKFRKNDEIAITKSPYWIKKHKKIDEKVFAKNDIKSKANCVACHKDIDKGVISKSLIDRNKIK